MGKFFFVEIFISLSENTHFCSNVREMTTISKGNQQQQKSREKFLNKKIIYFYFTGEYIIALFNLKKAKNTVLARKIVLC